MFIETMGQNYLLPWSPKHKSRKMKLKFIQLFENTLDKEVEMVVPLMSSELIEELDYLAYTSVITEINHDCFLNNSYLCRRFSGIRAAYSWLLRIA